MISPQSCTATSRFIFTMPVSMSTETSAICTPPTPWLFSRHGLARVVLAHLGDRLLAQLPAGRLPGQALRGVALDLDVAVRPLRAGRAARRAPAPPSRTASASAFSVALRVEDETPPTVVEPPEAPEGG